MVGPTSPGLLHQQRRVDSVNYGGDIVEILQGIIVICKSLGRI